MPASGPLHVLPRKPVCSTSTGPAEPQARIGPPAGKVERATEPHVPGQAGREGVKNRGELRGALLHYATQVAPNEHAHQNAGEAEGGALSACTAALIANAAELPSSPGGNGPARETLGTEALSWHGAGRSKAPRGGKSLGRAGRPPRAPRGPRRGSPRPEGAPLRLPAPRGGPAGRAHSPSGVVPLSQSQASTMRVKERCGHRRGRQAPAAPPAATAQVQPTCRQCPAPKPSALQTAAGHLSADPKMTCPQSGAAPGRQASEG